MTPVSKSGLPIAQQPSNRNQPDPAVVARAMEMLKAQREPNSPPPIRSGISTTAQQSLSLPEGQYVGDVKDGVPHGRGKLTYHPGEARKKYEGQWENGLFHGRGILKFSNGDQFEGQWENGLQHGEGLRTLADGTKYEGSFARGNRHGKGACQFANGDNYVGDWENNKFHGKGTYQNAKDESSYEGDWQNGERNGHGIAVYPRDVYGQPYRVRYEGEWLNDKKHGQGRQESDLGGGQEVSEGIFQNNEIWTGTENSKGITDSNYKMYKNGRMTCCCWNPCADICSIL